MTLRSVQHAHASLTIGVTDVQSGDTLILVGHFRTNSSTSGFATVSGCGATWTKQKREWTGGTGFAHRALEVWVGTGATSSGTVTVSMANGENVNNSAMNLWVLGGARDITILTSKANTTSVTTPSVDAKSGDVVIAALTHYVSSGEVWPSSPAPSADWSSHAHAAIQSFTEAKVAWRVPTEGTATAHTVSATGLDTGGAGHVMLGLVASPAAAPGTEVTLAGTAASASASFNLTHTPAPAEITLAGTAAGASAAFALDSQPPPPDAIEVTLAGAAASATAAFTLTAEAAPVEVALAGVAAPATATFTLESSAPTIIESSTRWENDGYNMGGIADVFHEDAIAPTPARIQRTKVRRVHQSLPAPTLVDGRPT